MIFLKVYIHNHLNPISHTCHSWQAEPSQWAHELYSEELDIGEHTDWPSPVCMLVTGWLVQWRHRAWCCAPRAFQPSLLACGFRQASAASISPITLGISKDLLGDPETLGPSGRHRLHPSPRSQWNPSFIPLEMQGFSASPSSDLTVLCFSTSIWVFFIFPLVITLLFHLPMHLACHANCPLPVESFY